MSKFESGWKEFLKTCQKLQNQKSFSDFMDLLLTAEEREDISKRYLIIKSLLKGDKTQRQIAQELNVSIAKITRGSNELKRMDKKWLELFF